MTELSTVAPLFETFQLGGLTLANRVVMAPMTRSRARQPGNVQTEMHARYYAQRAGAGLIISEGTQISLQGQGYAWTPGIYSAEQVAGWRLVTDAVHAAGGRIFAQIWHVGRISHPAVNGLQPVGPSAVRAEGVKTFIIDEQGPRMDDVAMPRALDIGEIPGIVADYVTACHNAIAAGFDGVEIHAANGYLIDQFMRSGANFRQDAYGGSLDNRLRLLGEIATACVGAIGADKVGVRLSPFLVVNGLDDATPHETFMGAVRVLADVGVGFIHFNEENMIGHKGTPPAAFRAEVREAYTGAIILCGGYTAETGAAALASGDADLIGYGRPYIGNPDLTVRMRRGLPLVEADRATYFGGGEAGYTDFPTVEAA